MLNKLMFRKKWNEFARECKKHRIIAKSNFGCCPNCGSNDMEESYENGRYKAYVFFHAQESDRIKNDIKSGENKIVVHLNWSSIGWRNR